MRILKEVGMALLGLFVVWPWLIGCVDLAIWLIGFDLKPFIPWSFERVLVGLCWPFATAALATFLLARPRK